jgi:hypothetical protein
MTVSQKEEEIAPFGINQITSLLNSFDTTSISFYHLTDLIILL